MNMFTSPCLQVGGENVYFDAPQVAVSRKRALEEAVNKLVTTPKGRPPKQKKVFHHTQGHDYLVTDRSSACSSSFNEIDNYLCENKNEKSEYMRMKLRQIQHVISDMESTCSQHEDIKKSYLELAKKAVSIEMIKDSSDKCRFWTGFQNFGTFLAVFHFIEPRAKMIKMWRGAKRFLASPLPSERFKERKLKPVEEFFLTMIRIRTGMMVAMLAHCFGVSAATVSQTVTSYVVLLAQELKWLCMLPSWSCVAPSVSPSMKRFEKLLIILDCTEVFVQKPSDLSIRKQLYSEYKGHETLKFLVGLGPHMGLTYVSRMYGGRASDKYITLESRDLINNLRYNRKEAMGDKGFLIEAELKEKDIKIHVPSVLTSDRPYLSPDELQRSENISSVRIHVERLIRRIKENHIFDKCIPMNMVPIAEQLFMVCAYLTNFQSPIVRK